MRNDEWVARGLLWLDCERAEVFATEQNGSEEDAAKERMYYLGAKHLFHAILCEDVEWDPELKRHRIVS